VRKERLPTSAAVRIRKNAQGPGAYLSSRRKEIKEMRDSRSLIGETDLVRFWAKTTYEAEKCPRPYHPLTCHLIDVASAALAMWKDVLPNTRKRRLAKPFTLEHDLDTAGVLIAFPAGLHDLGKCSPRFELRGKHTPETVPT